MYIQYKNLVKPRKKEGAAGRGREGEGRAQPVAWHFAICVINFEGGRMWCVHVRDPSPSMLFLPSKLLFKVSAVFLQCCCLFIQFCMRLLALVILWVSSTGSMSSCPLTTLTWQRGGQTSTSKLSFTGMGPEVERGCGIAENEVSNRHILLLKQCTIMKMMGEDLFLPMNLKERF